MLTEKCSGHGGAAMTRQMVAEGDEDVLCQRPDQHEAVIARWMAQLLRPKLAKATVGKRGEVFAPESVPQSKPDGL